MSDLFSEYLCHVYVRNDSLAGVVIADSEYPSRVAFTLLEKVSLQCGQTGFGWTSVVSAQGTEDEVICPKSTHFFLGPKPRDSLASLPSFFPWH